MTGLILAAAGAFAASLAATGLVLAQLRRRAVLAQPNARSSHAVPTPQGGGIAVMAVVLAVWGLTDLAAPQPNLWIPIAGAAGLAILSWLDDLRGLPAGLRLLAHIGAVAAGLIWLTGAGHGPVFQGLLPPWLDVAAAAVAWVWFVNLYNFMDGIDGIAGVETAGIGVGLAALGLLPAATAMPDPVLPLALAAAAAGFLYWNWHPAKLFMGDVGSVPLGFLLGGLLLDAAARGHWAPALILPLYYLADSTITLLRRAARRERVWQAHREHFYQRAVQNGRSHAQVAGAVLAADAALVVLALAATAAPWAAVAAAALLVAGLLWWMAR
ncbi:MAG: glycosyltransferase family 4 protein [Alphaproteobacteria bacterium]